MEPAIQALIAFALMSAVFTPLEKLFPAHRQSIARKEWGTDLCFFFGQYLLWTAPVVAVLTFFSLNAHRLPLAGLREAFASQPLWLQGIEVILLCDVSIYWAHRFSHTNKFLWRFHRVHHTAERIDWVAAYREHPLDNLFTRFVENAPAILLGFPLPWLAGFAVFRGMWSLYIHSNSSLDPGPLRYLLGSPRLHHWHHERNHHARVNFANLSPLMDLLFGTYHDPGHMPERYGIAQRIPHHYVRQLVDPLLPRAIRARLPRG